MRGSFSRSASTRLASALIGAVLLIPWISSGDTLVRGGRLYIDLSPVIPTYWPDRFADREPPPAMPLPWMQTLSTNFNFPLPDLSRENPDSQGNRIGRTGSIFFTEQPILGRRWNLVSEAGTPAFTTQGSLLMMNSDTGSALDAPLHFVPRPLTQEVAAPDTRGVSELTLGDLVGDIVLIDISDRVQEELDRVNGAMRLVDFSVGSGRNVDADDIDAIAHLLTDGTFIIVRTGWERFHFEPWNYKNEVAGTYNWPGVDPDAVQAVIDIEDARGIRINGWASDTKSIDTGELLTKGIYDEFDLSNGSPLHVRGLQRGWKLLEDLVNLEELARLGPAPEGTLIVGAIKLNGAGEAPARVIAIVEDRIFHVIDIKPGSEPNPINPISEGLIPVAILGSDTFDILDVDVTTLAFGPAGAPPAHEPGSHAEDVNDDGFTDLVSHYGTRESGISFGETEACVTGELLAGTPFEGCDTVATPSCGLGFEIVLLLPPLVWLRQRRRRRAPA